MVLPTSSILIRIWVEFLIGQFILEVTFSIRLGPMRWVPTAHCAGRRGLNLLTAVSPVELAHCPILINLSHESDSAYDKRPTMPHFRTEICTHSCYKMLHCGIWTGAFWDLWLWFMVPAFYHDGAVCNSGIPISANRRPRLPWRHHWKAMHCRSTTHGCLCKLDSVTVATGIPRFDCHILLYTLKMHTSDNFLDIHNDGINPFTLSNYREMCSFDVFLHVGAWHGRALITFVFYCDVIARA